MADNNPSTINNNHALIVAHDEKLGIGKENKLPWHIKGDMRFFRNTTSTIIGEPGVQNAVIMGRRTWESIPANYRPLPERINLVLTKYENYQLPAHVLRSKSIEQALELINKTLHGKIFVIGGAAIYNEAIKCKEFSLLYVTEILGQYDCDVFFPEYRNNFNLIDCSSVIQEGNYTYWHKTYRRQS